MDRSTLPHTSSVLSPSLEILSKNSSGIFIVHLATCFNLLCENFKIHSSAFYILNRGDFKYKIELLNTQLQNYNDRLNDFLRGRDTLNIQQLDDYVCEHTFEDLRVTLINKNGTVIYDNLEKDPSHFENHHNRQEIKEAITYGSGYSINRQSESLGGEFFYSAKYYPNLDYIIRSALPYNVSLMRHLKADSHYVWFTLIISLILIIIFYRFTHKLGIRQVPCWPGSGNACASQTRGCSGRCWSVPA